MLQYMPPDTPLKKLTGAIKARQSCEQAHQPLKEELGAGRLEARSWQGLHRHALITMIAFTFLQTRRNVCRNHSCGLPKLRPPPGSRARWNRFRPLTYAQLSQAEVGQHTDD